MPVRHAGGRLRAGECGEGEAAGGSRAVGRLAQCVGSGPSRWQCRRWSLPLTDRRRGGRFGYEHEAALSSGLAALVFWKGSRSSGAPSVSWMKNFHTTSSASGLPRCFCESRIKRNTPRAPGFPGSVLLPSACPRHSTPYIRCSFVWPCPAGGSLHAHLLDTRFSGRRFVSNARNRAVLLLRVQSYIVRMAAAARFAWPATCADG